MVVLRAAEAFIARADRPLALYGHVPYCRHRCVFCPFYQNRGGEGFSASYGACLAREIEMVADVLGSAARERRVDAVYFGGGTPSDMAAADLAAVLRRMKDRFVVDSSTEVTVEGRVRDFTREKAEAWMEAGANRFSLGLQSTDIRLRRNLGRLADRDEITEVLGRLKQSGALVIVDLIFGLPGQTRASLEEDIRFLAEETPVDGLDLYQLIQFPGSPLATALAKGRNAAGPLPDQMERARMFRAAAEALERFGFDHFTPQHWRRNQSERSFYNRLAKSDADVLPFGASAGGKLGGVTLRHERDATRHAAEVDAGVIPLRCLKEAGEMDMAGGFEKQLAEAVEERRLPAPPAWPRAATSWAKDLVRNWQDAGLLEPAGGDGRPRLSLAGCYWAKHLQQLILECVETPSRARKPL